jgi:hypothetical protein
VANYTSSGHNLRFVISAILTLQIVDGKIVEDRLDGGKLSLLQQLGVIPTTTRA